jgi:hypothetical protein
MKNTIKRNWLKKQIELGKVEAKCNFKLTDDYAWDNADNFGKTDWMPARISHPTYAEYTTACGSVCTRCVDDDFVQGSLNFHDSDFAYKTGYACHNDDGTIRFSVLSGELYTLRIKE